MHITEEIINYLKILNDFAAALSEERRGEEREEGGERRGPNISSPVSVRDVQLI